MNQLCIGSSLAFSANVELVRVHSDKEWIVCRTAWSDFNGIVQLLGGATEQKRAAQLLNRVTIVDDRMSPRASNLQPRGKIKERSKVSDVCRFWCWWLR